MTVGAEPKKVAILVLLMSAGVYLFYSNVLSTPSEPPRSASPAPASSQVRPADPPPVAARQDRVISRAAPARAGVQEFRPSLKPRRPEDRPDPTTVDPTLRLDLMAKLREIEPHPASRNLFEFAQPPAPKTPEPKIEIKSVEQSEIEADQEAEKAKAEPVKPPPPPIPLKFYGYIAPARQGPRRAFFLEGEDIFVASEGEVVKRRYKIVRIGVNSAVVEDTEHQHQQTLPLEEQAG